jgi:predicted nucleic acid-binding protein
VPTGLPGQELGRVRQVTVRRLVAGSPAALWESRDGCLSVQVLQEFFVSVTRKIAKPLDAETAKEIIADLSRWHVHVPAADDVLGVIDIHQRTGISFWDAMIVRSAAQMGCTGLYSEDLNAGQEYSGVLAENPFRPPTSGRA